MFRDRKMQHYEHVSSPHTSLWIQCNLSKFLKLIPFVFFIKLGLQTVRHDWAHTHTHTHTQTHRTPDKIILKHIWLSKGLKNSQDIPEKDEVGGNLVSGIIMKLYGKWNKLDASSRCPVWTRRDVVTLQTAGEEGLDWGHWLSKQKEVKLNSLLLHIFWTLCKLQRYWGLTGERQEDFFNKKVLTIKGKD